MTKILPQEAAVIYAATNFMANCADLPITAIPREVRHAFAALEAACKVYDETLEEPSEVVDAEDDDCPGDITFDMSDLTGLEPGIHLVRFSPAEQLPSGRFRVTLEHVTEPHNIVPLSGGKE
jgi:hypothetical protein